MRAARITELTGPSSITAEDLDAPAPPEDGVVIDVRAAGVCFPDVLLSRGEYQMKPDPPFTPGCEVAGVVSAVGRRSRYGVGDRVAAFPFLGGFAEQVACADALTFALPDSVGFEAGAALPMNYFTVHFALVTRGGLRAGESVLVHGAAGGIGTAAVQLAKALGATVYAVVSDDAKAAVALEAGADETILADGFLSRVKELTGGRGVDEDDVEFAAELFEQAAEEGPGDEFLRVGRDGAGGQHGEVFEVGDARHGLGFAAPGEDGGEADTVFQAEQGVLARVASAIAEEDCNIQSVHMDNEQGAYTALNFILQVRDRMQLARVMRAVRRVQEVVRIGRIKGDDRAS